MATLEAFDAISTRLMPVGDDALTEPWQCLVAADPAATVFSTPFFQRALFSTFGPPDPRMIVLEKGGRIVGLMPVVPLALRWGPATLREAGFLRCAHTLRNTLLIPPGDAAARALLTALQRKMPYDSLLFQNVPAAGGRIESLRQAASAVGLRADTPQPGRKLMYCDLENGHDAFLATRSGNQRRQFSKRRRNLEAEGDLRFTRLKGAAIADAIPEWRAIVACSWQGQDADAVGNTQQDWDFHRLLVENGALFIMYLDHRPIACLRILQHDNVAYLHTMHYDQSLRNLAPGLVLFDHVLRDNAARGMRRMDFNGNTELYKRCATGETPHQTLRLYRPTVRGRAARNVRRLLKR